MAVDWRAEAAALASPVARATYLQRAFDEAPQEEKAAISWAWLDAFEAGVSALGERMGLPPFKAGEDLPEEFFEDPWAV